jgi:hypothetical protein
MQKRKSITLGYYPFLSLKGARELAFEIKSDLKRGIDPKAFFKTTKIKRHYYI